MKVKKQHFILALSTVLLLTACSQKAPEATTTAVERITPVQVELVKNGSVSLDAGLTAKLAPSQEVNISPKVTGKITSLPVKLGQYVGKGAVLFHLDEADLENGVRQAEAALQVAQAGLRQSGSNSNSGLEQAKNGLKQSEQALKDAQVNQQRMQNLFNQGAVSSQQMEQANSQLTNAQTAYDNAKMSLSTAQQMGGVQVSEASVKQAAVSLQNARTQLANAVVTAPFSGYISSVNGEVGQFASPQAPVITLVNTNPLVVKANISENDITKVKVGTGVKVEVSALAKVLDAKVTAVSPVMDPQLKAYPTEISIPNPSNELKSDMVVNVKFNFDSTGQKKVPLVSRKAIFEREGKSYVYVIENNVAKQVEVTVGQGSSDEVEILTGVKEGATVVVKGQTLLKDGGKVKIQKQE
ncbi:efflux RND transporter periplasmic adaptor subunit [Brevibacillus ginsengisoli]|uniref:efflux RND transporter periplasmic adaptor subunit n=1 Tax=Brevibacillus ginsengisoli TaxID=363854 RepID=UPI003CEF77BD